MTAMFFGHLRQQDRSLERRHQEVGDRLRLTGLHQLPSRLGLPEHEREPLLPCCKHRSQPRAKSLVHVAELGGQVAHRAAAHALALRAGASRTRLRKHRICAKPVALGVGEARLERALQERADDLVQDRVAEVFLAPEVVSRSYPFRLRSRAARRPARCSGSRGRPSAGALAATRSASRVVRPSLVSNWDLRVHNLSCTNQLVQNRTVPAAMRQAVGGRPRAAAMGTASPHAARQKRGAATRRAAITTPSG